jgi:hypothetical protein
MFLEWYRFDLLAAEVGHPLRLAQGNLSVSARGVVRCIHYADVPTGQANRAQQRQLLRPLGHDDLKRVQDVTRPHRATPCGHPCRNGRTFRHGRAACRRILVPLPSARSGPCGRRRKRRQQRGASGRW